jgi:signal transduction histidine kinase
MVLVVDDEAGNRRGLARQLAAEGFGVVTAANSCDALATMRRADVDVALIYDIASDERGTELARTIKQDELLRDVPVIVFSADADVSARMRVLAAGAEEVLPASVDTAELVIRLRNLLRLRASQRELRVRNVALSRLLEQESERVAYYERFTRNAFDALTAQIAILDREGAIVSVNEAWRRFMREHERDFEIGRPYRADQLASEADAIKLQEGVTAVLRGEREQFILDYQFGSANRAGFYTARVNRFRDADLGYVVVSHEDITDEQKTRSALDEAASQLQETRAQVLHAQKMESVGRLAGGVAHDFNNLLVGILGHTSMALGEAAPGSPIRRHLEQIESSARAVAAVTDQMLAFSGNAWQELTDIDLGRHARELHERFGSVAAGVEVHISTAPDLPVVRADLGQLRRITANLLDNAFEALGPAGGTVSIATGALHVTRMALDSYSVGTEAAPGLYAYLDVADDGAGMSEDIRHRMFEPFFTTKFQGRGLGLAAVDGLVRGHGGAIAVHSAPGAGTRVRVLLPAAA